MTTYKASVRAKNRAYLLLATTNRNKLTTPTTT